MNSLVTAHDCGSLAGKEFVIFEIANQCKGEAHDAGNVWSEKKRHQMSENFMTASQRKANGLIPGDALLRAGNSAQQGMERRVLEAQAD